MMSAATSNAPRQNARRHWLILNVGVRVDKPGVPTNDFDLIDIDGTGLVRPQPDPEINLLGIKQKVLIVFHLQDALGLLFPKSPLASIGLDQHSAGCPRSPENAANGMFRKGLSLDRRQLAMVNRNNDRKQYVFALFMEDSEGKTVAVCDPRIVNN
jgi:hypothetical protein